MTQIGQMCFATLALFEQSRIRVGRRSVRVVAALLPMEIAAVAFVITSILAHKRGLRGPGADHGAVHREVFVGQQIVCARTVEHLIEQHLRRTASEQASRFLVNWSDPTAFMQGKPTNQR